MHSDRAQSATSIAGGGFWAHLVRRRDSPSVSAKIVFLDSGLVGDGDGAKFVIGIGALGFGLVLGWASGFVAPSRAGVAFRLFVAIAGTAVLVGSGTALGASLAAIALGLGAHELLLALVRRRIA